MNARDAFEEKSVKNKIILISVKEDESSVIIIIKDNAGGIPKEILPRIFESFFTTKGSKGSGFGLYLVKMIVHDSMGGQINVSSDSEGTAFEISIPKNNR